MYNNELAIYVYINDTREHIEDREQFLFEKVHDGYTIHRSKELNRIYVIELRKEDRTIDVHQSGFREDTDSCWKNEIEQFYQIVCDKTLFDSLFSDLNTNIFDFHLGIWQQDKAHASSTQEEENCEKYKDWKYIVVDFDLSILNNNTHEILKKIDIYPYYRYEEQSYIFYFKEFSIEVLKQKLDIIKKLYKLSNQYDLALEKIQTKLFEELNITQNIERIRS